MKFEWHPAKAAANEEKHGVTFDEAATAFGDPLSLTIADPDHSDRGDRFILLGESFDGRRRGCTYREGRKSPDYQR